MGQSWVVALIAAGVILALFVFFRNRRAEGPNKKAIPPKKETKPDANAAKPQQGTSTPAPPDGPASTKPVSLREPAKAGSESEKPGPRRIETMREPAVARKQAPPQVAKLHEDDDDDITIVTLTPRLDLMAAAGIVPDMSQPEPDDEDAAPPESDQPAAVPIIYDEDAAEDEPTRTHAVILVAAVGQTDLGQKRKINEDRYLVMDDHNLYVVADGMGGHAGGEVASQCAVDTIEHAFKTGQFEGTPYENVPRRGGELALAIQMANATIFEKQKKDPKLTGMGTTIVSARFTPGKQRVYIGHVGDSRCYRFRAGQLTQVTTDHTMAAIGMTGPFADHLSRAVGIAPAVKVDLVIAKPRHEDIFLLCSDGLSKMVKDEAICEVLAAHSDPNEAVKALVERANMGGGRDNITVILVVVKDPRGFAQYMIEQERKRKAANAAAMEAVETAESPVMPGGDPKPGAGPVPVRSVEVEEPPAISVQPVSHDSALGQALDPNGSDTEIMRALEPLGTDSGGIRSGATKPADGATGSQEVRARPSVPPRPSTPSAPPPRPSTPSAPPPRSSVPEARKSEAKSPRR